MDTNTLPPIIVIIFAAVGLAGFWRYGRRGSGAIKGPFGAEMSFEGSNEPATPADPQRPGVLLEDANARGSITAADETGRGTEARRLEAEGDITATSRAGPEAADPKA